MKKILLTCFLILLVGFLSTFVYASQQGCCSWHGGLCGNNCCDGTSLSNSCINSDKWCSAEGMAKLVRDYTNMLYNQFGVTPYTNAISYQIQDYRSKIQMECTLSEYKSESSKLYADFGYYAQMYVDTLIQYNDVTEVLAKINEVTQEISILMTYKKYDDAIKKVQLLWILAWSLYDYDLVLVDNIVQIHSSVRDIENTLLGLIDAQIIQSLDLDYKTYLNFNPTKALNILTSMLNLAYKRKDIDASRNQLYIQIVAEYDRLVNSMQKNAISNTMDLASLNESDKELAIRIINVINLQATNDNLKNVWIVFLNNFKAKYNNMWLNRIIDVVLFNL